MTCRSTRALLNGPASTVLVRLNRLDDRQLPFSMSSVYSLMAEIEYQRALESHRRALHGEGGLRRDSSREWLRAIPPLQTYLGFRPDDEAALLRLGRALRETYNYREAETVYSQALALSPLNWEALNGKQNCLRRRAASLMTADFRPQAEALFSEAEGLISTMQNSAGDDGRRIRVAQFALARLFWEAERYGEAMAYYGRLVESDPEDTGLKEDLAAITLERGQRASSSAEAQRYIGDSYRLYMELYDGRGASNAFVGAGLAEAAAELESAGADDLVNARQACERSLAEGRAEDPYPSYALARVLWRLGDRAAALDRLADAIRRERRRSTNPHTFDFVRLHQYESRLDLWCAASETTDGACAHGRAMTP